MYVDTAVYGQCHVTFEAAAYMYMYMYMYLKTHVQCHYDIGSVGTLSV